MSGIFSTPSSPVEEKVFSLGKPSQMDKNKFWTEEGEHLRTDDENVRYFWEKANQGMNQAQLDAKNFHLRQYLHDLLNQNIRDYRAQANKTVEHEPSLESIAADKKMKEYLDKELAKMSPWDKIKYLKTLLEVIYPDW